MGPGLESGRGPTKPRREHRCLAACVPFSKLPMPPSRSALRRRALLYVHRRGPMVEGGATLYISFYPASNPPGPNALRSPKRVRSPGRGDGYSFGMAHSHALVHLHGTPVAPEFCRIAARVPVGPCDKVSDRARRHQHRHVQAMCRMRRNETQAAVTPPIRPFHLPTSFLLPFPPFPHIHTHADRLPPPRAPTHGAAGPRVSRRSLSRALSLQISLSHSHSHSKSRSSLSLSQHTHSLSLSRSLYVSRALSLACALSLSRALSPPLSRSRSRSRSLSSRSPPLRSHPLSLS